MKKQRWRARDYVVIPRSLLTQKISPSALRVWIALASFCYDDDSCYPSNRAMLERMPKGTALNTIKAAKRELEQAGLIKRDRRFDKGRETSSIYYLIAPEGTQMITHNSSTPHEGNENVTPLNKYKENKTYLGNQKRTSDGFVYIEGEGWIEEEEEDEAK